ncbi:MAG TPA: hypothetical protein VFM18_18520 [Methanosarcina sp.]|nr:hypothetical protein [Methanosarcina sp.]
MYLTILENQQLNRATNLHYLSRLLRLLRHCILNPCNNGVRHHVLPKNKNWFPEYKSNKENIVMVSSKMHFLIHHLMWKTFYKDTAMYTAFWNMSHLDKTVRLTSKQFAILRDLHSQRMKDNNPAKVPGAMDSIKGEKNPAKRPEVRAKLAKAALKRMTRPENIEKAVIWGKMNKGIAGENNPAKRQSSRDKISAIHKGIPKIKKQCPYCNTLVGGAANYQRWHGDNCKSKN